MSDSVFTLADALQAKSKPPVDAFLGSQFVQLAREPLSFTAHSVRWLPGSLRAIVAGQSPSQHGVLQFWQFKDGAFKKTGFKESSSFGGFKCMCVNHAPLTYRTVATGGFDGAIAVWDPEDFAAGPVWYVREAHKGIIYCIDGCAGSNPAIFGAPEIATGGSDGIVRLWDTRQKEPVAELRPPEGSVGRQDSAVRELRKAQTQAAERAGVEVSEGYVQTVPPEVWAVALLAPSAEQRFVAAGYDTGLVVLWDVEKNEVLWSGDVGRGVTAVAFDRADVPPSKLFIGTLEGRITIVNIQGKPHKTLGYGSSAVYKDAVTLWFISPLPQNRNVIVTPGADGGLTLWKYEAPDSPVREEDGETVTMAGQLSRVSAAPMGQQPLSEFAWSSEFEGLFATVGYDQAVNFGVITKVGSL